MRGFTWKLVLIALAGLAARLAYGFLADAPQGLGDDVWYHEVANGIADGRGFADPFTSLGPDGREQFGDAGRPTGTAFHPPLFPALLALGSLAGASSYDAHQALACALGAGTVMVVGLAGRRLAGERVGLIAAAIAALYLPLIANDSLLMSESLYGLTVALIVLAALAYRQAPSARAAAVLGVSLAAACLTRGEALLLVVLLVVPLALAPPPRRWAHLGVACLVVVLAIAPWAVRNSLLFDRPVLVTTVEGSVVGGANTHSTYFGDMLGAWDFEALYSSPAGRSGELNEAVLSAKWHDEAVAYARAHAARVPVIAAIRLARTWSAYPFDPREKVAFAITHYNHHRVTEWLSLPQFVGVLGLAAFGLAALRRRGAPTWPLLAPIVLVCVVSVVAYGDLRFRQAAEVALVILAGVGAERLMARGAAPRRSSRLGPPRSDPV